MERNKKAISGNKKQVKALKHEITPYPKSLLSKKKKDEKKKIEEAGKKKPGVKSSAVLRKTGDKTLIDESSEKNRNFLKNINDGCFEVDLAGNFTFFNDSVCRVLGYSRAELMGMNNQQYTDKEELKRVFEAYNKVYKTGKPIKEFCWQVTRKDGAKRYIEGSISLLKDSSGKKTGFLGIVNDVTNREQADAKLRHSEEKYRNILEKMQEGYFEVDLAGNFTFCNDSLCRIHRRSKDEMMGINNRQYMDKENAKKVLEAFNQVYKTGEPLPEINWQIIRKDGVTRYIEASVSLLKDSSDKPIGFRGVTHDITERKQTEERLRDEKRRFRALADQSSDIIILVNNKGNITYENQASNILGLNTEDRIGINVFERVHPDDLKLVTDSFNILFSDTNAPVQKAEIRLRHLDGSWRTFEVIGSNLLRENAVESAIVNLRDITERKKSQELLKHSEEKYRLLADHMKDQVWTMDLNMKITYVSPSVERLTGYSSDEIKKMDWANLLTPESLQKATDFMSTELPRALKASSDYLLYKTMELEFILKGGQTVWGECAFSLIRDETGKAVSILGEARNIAERKLAEEKLQHTLEMLKKAVGTTIQVLVSALEARDPYTSGHQSRSANLACAIAKEMGLDEDKIEGINMAGIIHDIGKLSIPAEILSKPTKLTNIEFSLIKIHPQSGYEMLKDVESPWPLAEIVQQHHERMNGTGYPRNMKGDEILIEARIMAVADVVEAMISHRPYRASLGMEAAISEIEKNRGILYDEAVVDACLRLFREKGYKLA